MRALGLVVLVVGCGGRPAAPDAADPTIDAAVDAAPDAGPIRFQAGAMASADPLTLASIEFCGTNAAGPAKPFATFFNSNGNSYGVCLGERRPMNTIDEYTFNSALSSPPGSQTHAALIFVDDVTLQVFATGTQLICYGGTSTADVTTNTGATSCAIHGVRIDATGSIDMVMATLPDNTVHAVTLALLKT